MDRNAHDALLLRRHGVALRKESVDRNILRSRRSYRNPASLSARRAWIEIFACLLPPNEFGSRSPQGERG